MHTKKPQAIVDRTIMNNEMKDNDDDGFTVVEQKKLKLNMNMCGTEKLSSKIQLAELSVAVYISRLRKTTNVEHIKDYIKDMGGMQ